MSFIKASSLVSSLSMGVLRRSWLPRWGLNLPFCLACSTMPWVGNTPQRFINDKVLKMFFVFTVLSEIRECLIYIPTNRCTITFVTAILFKLGVWSDFTHYMMRFSTIYSHGLIRVYHRNIIWVSWIGSHGLNNAKYGVTWKNVKKSAMLSFLPLPISFLSLAKPAVPYQPFNWSACLSV